MTIGVSNKEHGVFTTKGDFTTLEVMCAMVKKVDVITIYDDTKVRHTFRIGNDMELKRHDLRKIFRAVEFQHDAENGF